MQAVRLYAAGDLRIEDIPEPKDPEPGEVLLKIEAAGICGSDLHNFHTGQWISRAPSVPGHEFVATVVQPGDGVNSLVVGDRVVADSRIPCTNCDACKRGSAYLCINMGFVGELNDGGFTSYTLQSESQIIKLPDQNVDCRIAVLSEPLAVALHAVNRVSAQAGESAVILGAGTIGALCAIVLKHRGVQDITIVDTSKVRQAAVSNAFSLKGYEAGDQLAVNLGIDTTGASAAMQTALNMIARGGRLSIVGLYAKPVTLDMNKVVEGGVSLAGCAAFNSELSEAIALLEPLQADLSRLHTVHIDINSVPDWYLKLSERETTIQKAIIECKD